jgi:HEAT repeat protein
MGLGLLAVCGCHGPFYNAIFGKPSDDVAGILHPQERITAIRKMADDARGNPQAEQQLLERMIVLYPQEKDPIIRCELVKAVSHMQSVHSFALLKDASKDGNLYVRIEACEALRKLPGPEATAALAEVLGSDVEADVRLTAVRALGERRDPKAMAALGAALEDRDPSMQYRVVQSLRQTAPQDLGDDVERWRYYVRGETPPPPKPVSIADRVMGMFY